MYGDYNKEFDYLDPAAQLALAKACKKTELKTIDKFCTVLKIYFITAGDLNNAFDFFEYVDKIAEKMREDVGQ